jgi:ubiquinone/menaquinone biosynthesis C-methylase UbiE
MNEKQQTSPRIRCADPVDHYRKDADAYDYFATPDRITAEYWNRLRTAAAREISRTADTLVLDVGSGSGWLVRMMEDSGVRVVSLDLSAKSLARIRRETGGEALVSPADRLPFADDTFDCVMASEVVEHLNDPGAAITEFFRVVKPGGRVVVTTPYRERIQWSLCVHCNRPTPFNAHLHSFNETSLGELFGKAGSCRTRFRRIGNKALVRLHLSYLLRALPLPIWLAIDTLANAILPKSQNIIMYGTK